MSKAEELAEKLRLEWRNDALNYDTAIDSAIELSRLAQVEAEHEALKKAISDAEPVAWLHKRDMGALTANEKWLARDNMRPFADACDTPLYTLNGIKK